MAPPAADSSDFVHPSLPPLVPGAVRAVPSGFNAGCPTWKVGHPSREAAMNSTRRHDIDALRVIAFGLLILYHVGMFYVADWGWHIKSAYLAEWLQHPMLLLNRWRMSLLFLVSGLAVNF